jgi:integrase/recombinase XerD
MTINRYRYFYAGAFDLYGDHLFAFVDRMAELDHAESTVNLYLSCINDVAKAMATAGNAACDLDEKRALELVAAMGWDGMGWIKSRETYARFMMKRFVGFLAERGVTRERSAAETRPASAGRWMPTPNPPDATPRTRSRSATPTRSSRASPNTPTLACRSSFCGR